MSALWWHELFLLILPLLFTTNWTSITEQKQLCSNTPRHLRDPAICASKGGWTRPWKRLYSQGNCEGCGGGTRGHLAEEEEMKGGEWKSAGPCGLQLEGPGCFSAMPQIFEEWPTWLGGRKGRRQTKLTKGTCFLLSAQQIIGGDPYDPTILSSPYQVLGTAKAPSATHTPSLTLPTFFFSTSFFMSVLQTLVGSQLS